MSATLLTRRRLLAIGVIVFIVTSLVLLHLLTGIEWLSQNFFVYRWSFIAGSNIALGCLTALLLCKSERAEFEQLGIYLRGAEPERRRRYRDAHARPLLEAFKPWLDTELRRIAPKSDLAIAMRYLTKRWKAFTR